jgi:hypothetical protein
MAIWLDGNRMMSADRPAGGDWGNLAAIGARDSAFYEAR